MQSYHFRAAPRDPMDKRKGAKIGSDGELYYPQFGELKPRVMKERGAFAGGFKIMEETRKPVEESKTEETEEEDILVRDVSMGLSKEMILKQLDLKKPEPKNVKFKDDGIGGKTRSELSLEIIMD